MRVWLQRKKLRRKWQSVAASAALACAALAGPAAGAQSMMAGMPPMQWTHLWLDQIEARTAGPVSGFRWDGEAWHGGDPTLGHLQQLRAGFLIEIPGKIFR